MYIALIIYNILLPVFTYILFFYLPLYLDTDTIFSFIVDYDSFFYFLFALILIKRATPTTLAEKLKSIASQCQKNQFFTNSFALIIPILVTVKFCTGKSSIIQIIPIRYILVYLNKDNKIAFKVFSASPSVSHDTALVNLVTFLKSLKAVKKIFCLYLPYYAIFLSKALMRLKISYLLRGSGTNTTINDPSSLANNTSTIICPSLFNFISFQSFFPNSLDLGKFILPFAHMLTEKALSMTHLIYIFSPFNLGCTLLCKVPSLEITYAQTLNILFQQHPQLYKRESVFLEISLQYAHIYGHALMTIISALYHTLLTTFNLNLSTLYHNSLSSIALAIYRLNYLNVAIHYLHQDIDFMMRPLLNLGGINRISKPFAKDIYVYDVNSLYPYFLLGPLPIRATSKPISGAPKEISKFVGYLHIKIKLGSARPRLRYAYFDDETKDKECWIYYKEYEHLLLLRYRLVILQHITVEEGVPLRDYVTSIYAIKSDSKADPSIKIVAKYLLNTLYGKLGQAPNTYKLGYDPKVKASESEMEPINLFRQNEKESSILTKLKDTSLNRTITNSNLLLSAAIPALGRIYKHKLLQEYHDKVVYTDTDSLHITEELRGDKIGSEIGEFKLEASKVRGYYYHLKGYIYGNLLTQKVAIAGLSKNYFYYNYKPIISGEIVPNTWRLPSTSGRKTSKESLSQGSVKTRLRTSRSTKPRKRELGLPHITTRKYKNTFKCIRKKREE